MGLNISKRVSSLRKQVDQTQAGRWPVARITLLAFLFLALISLFALPKNRKIEFVEVEEPTNILVHRQRVKQLQSIFQTRRTYLDDSFIVLMPGAVNMFDSFGDGVISSFSSTEPKEGKQPSAFELDELTRWFSFYSANALLRAEFIIVAFAPLWLLAGLAGYLVATKRRRGSKQKNVLSVLTRGLGPFYSGIYGPLQPNNSLSGTNLSCPSLACPPLETEAVANSHPLANTLKKFNATNDTNIQLIRTILAHAEFPPYVGEELPVQQEEDDHNKGSLELEERKSNTGYFEVDGNLTLEKHATDGLAAVLEAHARIVRYRSMLEKRSFDVSTLNKNYPAHEANIAKLLKGASEQTTRLLQVLSPDRLWALGGLSSSLVATTYLSIEAGKSLVYQRHGDGFTRISNYPHLQARAVVQSIPRYHEEYDGDFRLIIRQAIICSRRHGDFGRAFLPNRMPIESRALRDWLEIMYASTDERTMIADLVELDAHIEEIGINWRKGFASLVQDTINDEDITREQNVARGMPFKSIVLFPIESVTKTSLSGIHPKRLERISALLPKTQKYQSHLSISARLPGFKRQAVEAERSGGDDSDAIIKALQAQKNGDLLLAHWRITRRMLTRYNWLSTRVGDDAVPVDGLLLGRIEDDDPTVLPPLVPIRQRRFVELFGKKWEKKLYKNPINSDLIQVHVTQKSYQGAVDIDEEVRKEILAEKQAVAAGK